MTTRLSSLGKGLVLLCVALAASACVGDIEAPRCATVDDCDRASGYLFCHRGYCFKTPTPSGLSPDFTVDTSTGDLGVDGASDLADDASPEPDGAPVCGPGTPALSGDGCCPAGGGVALGDDLDCRAWRVPFGALRAPLVAALRGGDGLPSVVATMLRGGGSSGAQLIVAGVASDGAILWESPMGPASSLVAPVVGPDGVVVVAWDEWFATLRPDDGIVNARAAKTLLVPPVILSDGRIVVVESDGLARLFDSKLVDAGVIASSGGRSVSLAAPAVVGDRLVVVDDEGRLAAWALAGGDGPLWTLELGAAPARGALAASGDVIVVLTAEPAVVFVRDMAEHAERLARFALSSAPASGLVIDGAGRVVVALAEGALVAFGADDGVYGQAWRAAIPGSTDGVPPSLLSDGTLLVGGAAGLAALLAPDDNGVASTLWTLATDRPISGQLVTEAGLVIAGASDGSLAAFSVGVDDIGGSPWSAWRHDPWNTGWTP